VALCVTEILANVHRHVESPECELRLEKLPDGVLAAVSDSSRTLPRFGAAPDWAAECGRGMFLIAGTADRWGTASTRTGKQVGVVLR
jgi:hypothetical protein